MVFYVELLTACSSINTALTMGHIIAVAAELEIHNDIKVVTNVSPKCKLNIKNI